MEAMTHTLIEHGYLVLFVVVLLDQVGVPVPALPVVVAAGGLAGAGRLDPVFAIAVATLGAAPGDWAWYELGRRHGLKIVRLLCRISLEPDSCVRGTQGIFARHGPRSLLVAKWVPGLQTVAPPLAGAARMERRPFLAYSLAGGLIWSSVLIGAGYAFHDQLEVLGTILAEMGGYAVVLLGGGLALYIGFKLHQRRRLIRSLRTARISPVELGERLGGEEPVEIVDLRHPVDFAADPYLIPGARRVAPDELEEHHEDIPRDRDIVLYCT